MTFTEINVAELNINPFTKIDEWALLTVGVKHQYNMLTVTGLMLGQLWKKKTVQVYIQPPKYSLSVMNKSQYFTVSFFPEPRCHALAIAGKLHGDQCDKVKETGLTPQFDQNGVYFKEAEIVVVCRKIYHTDVKPSLFDARDIFESYYTDPAHQLRSTHYHRIFIGEVEKVLKAAK